MSFEFVRLQRSRLCGSLLSSRLHQTVVILTASVTGRVVFPLYHAEAASSADASVLWLVAEGKLGPEAVIFYGWMG